MWYLILYGILTVWVFIDALRRKNNPIGWPLGTLILGPIFLPIYLSKRNLKKGEVREGGTSWNILKYFAIIWTITMVVAGIAGIANASNVVNQATTGAEEAGAAIGTTLGLGVIFILWIVVLIGALAIGLFLKKSSIVEEGPTGDLIEVSNNK